MFVTFRVLAAALHVPRRERKLPPGVEARVMRRRRSSPSRQRSEDRVASRSLGRATAEFGAHRLAKTRVNDPRLHPRRSLARPIFLILLFLLLLILVCRPRPRRRESLIGERGPESLRGRGGPLAGQRQRAHRRRRARGQLAHPRAPQLVGGELGAVLGGRGRRGEVRVPRVDEKRESVSPRRHRGGFLRDDTRRGFPVRLVTRYVLGLGLGQESASPPVYPLVRELRLSVGGAMSNLARGARRAGVSGELTTGT